MKMQLIGIRRTTCDAEYDVELEYDDRVHETVRLKVDIGRGIYSINFPAELKKRFPGLWSGHLGPLVQAVTAFHRAREIEAQPDRVREIKARFERRKHRD